jgi:PTH1 family peptidyl-tRNA hydrolase
MKLIIGLGNPGPEYHNNRHNIGWQILDSLPAALPSLTELPDFKIEKKFKAAISKGHNTVLAKPLTFMNNSGQSVKALKTFYKVKPGNIIVIHDDIDLPIGKIRISQDSSSAGNKGIESIIKELGTKDFIRVRLGVANSQRTKIPADKFVLQNFSLADKKILKRLLPQIVACLQMLINNEPLSQVQNKFN